MGPISNIALLKSNFRCARVHLSGWYGSSTQGPDRASNPVAASQGSSGPLLR